jgi:hypothetical protein
MPPLSVENVAAASGRGPDWHSQDLGSLPHGACFVKPAGDASLRPNFVVASSVPAGLRDRENHAIDTKKPPVPHRRGLSEPLYLMTANAAYGRFTRRRNSVSSTKNENVASADAADPDVAAASRNGTSTSASCVDGPGAGRTPVVLDTLL